MQEPEYPEYSYAERRGQVIVTTTLAIVQEAERERPALSILIDQGREGAEQVTLPWSEVVTLQQWLNKRVDEAIDYCGRRRDFANYNRKRRKK